MSKSKLAIRIGQICCMHNWDVKSWRYELVYPKVENALVLSTCQKCGKTRLLKPKDNLVNVGMSEQ